MKNIIEVRTNEDGNLTAQKPYAPPNRIAVKRLNIIRFLRNLFFIIGGLFASRHLPSASFSCHLLRVIWLRRHLLRVICLRRHLLSFVVIRLFLGSVAD